MYDRLFFYNNDAITNRDLGWWVSGVVVTDNQLIVGDRNRLLFWNDLASLTNGKPADGFGGGTNELVTSFQGSDRGGCLTLKADKNHHVWLSTMIDRSYPPRIAAYQTPLVSGARPMAIIGGGWDQLSTLPVLGGGQITLGGSIWGLAPTANSEFLWVCDSDNSRVFRIRNPLTSPLVDVILGQTSISGTLPNRGGPPDATTLAHPGHLALDRFGNLFVSDHSLEIRGNRRLLVFGKDLFPADNPSVIFAPAAMKIFPNIAVWEPAFDSQNRMVVGYNPYHHNIHNPGVVPQIGVFPGIYNDPLGASTSPDEYLKDYHSGAYGVAFDDNNNLYVADMNRSRVLIYKALPADLTISSIYGDTNGWYGQSRSQRVMVANQGSGASGATSLRAYLSQDAVWDAADVPAATVGVPALGPSQSIRVDYTFNLPASWPTRTVYVIAVIDPDNAISETNEANNTKFRAVGFTKMPYDVNGDGRVNIIDTGYVVEAFGGVPGTLVWNSSADQNADGSINIIDSGTVVAHFGDEDSRVLLHLTASPTSGTAPLAVTFTYHAHYFYGSVSRVEIDFEGNGTWDQVVIGGAAELKGSVTNTYAVPESYYPKARATDSAGNTHLVSGAAVTVQ
jgi:hypothetical protein